MTNVIKLEREIYIEMDINIVHYEEGNKIVIYFDRRPFAQELSTCGLNKPGESFADYCERMEYHQADSPPNYPVPAIRQHYEFGWSLSASAPVLIHVVQGPYGE